VVEPDGEPGDLRREDRVGRPGQRRSACATRPRHRPHAGQADCQDGEPERDAPVRQRRPEVGVTDGLVGGIARRARKTEETDEREDPRDEEGQPEQPLFTWIEARPLPQGIQHRQAQRLPRVVIPGPPDVEPEVGETDRRRIANSQQRGRDQHRRRNQRDPRMRAHDLARGVGPPIGRRIVRPDEQERQRGGHRPGNGGGPRAEERHGQENAGHEDRRARSEEKQIRRRPQDEAVEAVEPVGGRNGGGAGCPRCRERRTSAIADRREARRLAGSRPSDQGRGNGDILSPRNAPGT